MNLQLANVLSDVSGVTGQAIVKAILAGERNRWKLAAFRDNRVKVSEEEIARRLEESYLGAHFRRRRTRLGPPVAVKAMAAKLARLVYRMLRYGMQFVDQGAEFYEARHRQREIKSLKRKAANLGFQVTELATA